MKHVDPASEAFARLPREHQAKLYLAMGWTKEAVEDEFGICRDTLNTWLNPERYRRKLVRNAAAKRAKRRRKAAQRGDTRARNVTDSDKAEMRALRLKGKTVKEIAAITGFHARTVENHLAGAPYPKGFPCRKKRVLDYAKAFRLRQKGMFYYEIAEAIGAKTASAAFLAVQKYLEENPSCRLDPKARRRIAA